MPSFLVYKLSLKQCEGKPKMYSVARSRRPTRHYFCTTVQLDLQKRMSCQHGHVKIFIHDWLYYTILQESITSVNHFNTTVSSLIKKENVSVCEFSLTNYTDVQKSCWASLLYKAWMSLALQTFLSIKWITALLGLTSSNC